MPLHILDSAPASLANSHRLDLFGTSTFNGLGAFLVGDIPRVRPQLATMVREDPRYSSGTVSSDDDINTVPSRYTFANTAASSISSVDLQDYGTYSKLGGGMKRQPTVVVPSSTSTAASLVTVDEGTSTEVEFRDSPSKDGKSRQQDSGSVGTGKSHIFPKFGMFRASPQKSKTEESKEQPVESQNSSSTPSWMQAAGGILTTTSEDDALSQSRQASGSPVKPDSPNREVRRYKNDGSRLEQLLNNVEDEKDDLEASMTSVSLGDQLSSTGMYSALYSDYASSKDDYSLNATEEGVLNASDSQFSRAAFSSQAASTRTTSSQEANSLEAEVDAESKQASLDYHAMTTALNQTTNPGSPTLIAPSHFFQPVVRNVCDEDDDSNDVRTVSRSVEANSSYGDVPSLDAEYGSGLTDPTPALPAPMPSMAQRLFGGGLPAPVIKSIPQLKASPTNSTGATTSDDDDNEPRASAVSNASTPLRSGSKASFRHIQDILRDPNSAPHDLSDGEGSEKPAKHLSLDGTSFELVIPNNDYQKDEEDPQVSSIASITNAMERGRTMATQAPGPSNGAVDESKHKKSEESRSSNDTSSFFMAWVCLFLLLILGALIAGVCGSGYCSSRQWYSSSSSSSQAPPDDDLLANLPPDFFENSGKITFRPTASPVVATGQQIPSTTQVTSPTSLAPVQSDGFGPPPIVLVPIFVGGFVTPGERGQGGTPAAVVLSNPTELFEAVDNYVVGIAEAPIGSWDVSRITDFSQTFSAFRNDAMSTFNEDLTGWDTRNALSMRQMFHGAMNFNGDISSFDTSNVQNMREMFANAESFNGELSAWNTQRVTIMQGQFKGAFAFNGDIGSWNTDAVTDMSDMFLNAVSFNGRIGSWSTRNVVSMAGMFRGTAAFDQDLPWDTQRVVDMDAMFMESSSFDGSVSFNTQSVESMNRMFYYAGSFTGKGVADWDTRKVTTMYRMLTGAGSFVGDIASWDVSRVQNTEKMLAGASMFSQNLCVWQRALSSPPLLSSSANMFAHTKCEQQKDPTAANSYSTLCSLCAGAPFPEIDDTVVELVADLGQVFSGANELKAAVDAYLVDSSPDAGVAQLYGHPIGEWKVERVTDFSNLFSTSRNPAAIRFNENLGDWDMSSARTTTAMFEGAVSFSGFGLSTWDTSRVFDMSRMFAYSGFEEDISGWNVANVRDFGRMFMFAQSFQSDLSEWNVGSAEQMGWMFRGALQFSSDLSRWNVRNVQGFDKVFAGATRFASDLCSWKDQVKPESSAVCMFPGSACVSTADPSVASNWCSVCP